MAIPSLIRPPAIIAVNPTIDPTERSIPPVRITNVMPMARSALIATCFDMITMFPAVRNCGESAVNTATTTISAMNARPWRRNSRISIPLARWTRATTVLLDIPMLAPSVRSLVGDRRGAMADRRRGDEGPLRRFFTQELAGDRPLRKDEDSI